MAGRSLHKTVVRCKSITFLPIEDGEVSASYADGGVMNTGRDAHDPSVAV
jgi:hypothetical protein